MKMSGRNPCPSVRELEAVLRVLRAYIGCPETHLGTYGFIQGGLGANPGALLGNRTKS